MSENDCFDSISISATGLSAERRRMDVIANNIANMHTTRTEDGGPYRRQYVVFEEVLNSARSGASADRRMGGVAVTEIGRDYTDKAIKWVHDPEHPDAVKEGPRAGQVAMPNINAVSELVNMISAQRAYEANVQAILASRSIIAKSLEIAK